MLSKWHMTLKCVLKMIEEDVNHNVGPIDQCTTNMTEYVALPLQMYVAVRFDVHNSGWAPPP
eukprot:9932397-Prorocentrum_lima.AAC.1